MNFEVGTKPARASVESTKNRRQGSLFDAIFAILLVVSLLVPISAKADCAVPNALIGSLDFQAGVFKYCDGSNWLSLDNTSFPLLGSNQTPAAPTFSFSAGTNTGVYSPGTGQIAFATSGVERMRLSSTGNVGIGTTITPNRLSLNQTTAGTGTYAKLATPGTGASQELGLDLVTKDLGNELGTGSDFGWKVGAYGNAWGTASLQNFMNFSYFNGSVWTTPLVIDPATGNLGLGTLSPNQRVRITGSLNASTTVVSPLFTSAPTMGIDVIPGTATSSTANGSALSIAGGTSGATSGTGGAVVIIGGAGRSSYPGGTLTVSGGSSIGGNSTGATTTVKGGAATGTGAGGALQLLGGDVASAGALVGGAVTISGGNGTNGNAGGSVTLSAGDASGASVAGALANIVGGSATGTNKSGGDVVLVGGVPTGTGTRGDVLLNGKVGIGTSVPSTALDVRAGPISAGSQSTTLGGEVRLYDTGAGGSNYVALRAPSNVVTNMTWVLPPSDGSGGQFLATNAAGSLSWKSAAGGDFFRDGSAPMTGQLKNIVGSAAMPSYTIAGNTNTGFYHPGANQIGFSTGGQSQVRLNSRHLGINTASPTTTLEIRAASGDNDVATFRASNMNNVVVALHSFDQSGAPTLSPYQPGWGGWNIMLWPGQNNDMLWDSNANYGNPFPSIVFKGTGGMAVGSYNLPTGAALYNEWGAVAAGSQSSTLSGEIRLYDSGSTGYNYIALRAPNQVAADRTWILPGADGMAGQSLATNAAGSLSWTTGAGTVAKVDLTGQTGAIGYTTAYTAPNVAGHSYYQIGAFLETTTAGTGGTFTLTLRYTDYNNNVITTAAVCTVNANAIGVSSSSNPIYVKAGTAIQYSTQLNAVTGSPQYQLRLRIRELE